MSVTAETTGSMSKKERSETATSIPNRRYSEGVETSDRMANGKPAALSAPEKVGKNGRKGGTKEQKRRDLRRMKWLATGFFVAAAVVFVAIHGMEGYWWGFAESVAEAAMVGALADWFAVTALFRHPLYLPIPHTAIIPRNKDRIGKSLGDFVESHFLNASTVRQQVERYDVAETIGLWLNDPRNMRQVTNVIVDQAPKVVTRLRDPRVTQFVQANVVAQLKEVDFKPLLQRALTDFMEGGNPQRIVNSLLTESGKLIQANQEVIVNVLDNVLPRILRFFNVPDITLEKVKGTLEAMVENPDHPLRRQLVAMILYEARRQQRSEEARQWIDHVHGQLVDRPETLSVVYDLWQDLLRAVARDLEREEDSEILAALQRAATFIGHRILLDEAFQDAINEAVRDAASSVVRSHGTVVSNIIEEKVSGWDEQEVVENIELNVGRDLQFIRINGTIVGGLIGGLLYVIGNLPGI